MTIIICDHPYIFKTLSCTRTKLSSYTYNLPTRPMWDRYRYSLGHKLEAVTKGGFSMPFFMLGSISHNATISPNRRRGIYFDRNISWQQWNLA